MFELVLRAPQTLVEPVSDGLIDTQDALSVSVEDADAGSAAEQALFGEPGLPPPAEGWERSTLRALFESESAASEAAAALLSAYGDGGLVVQALQPVPDEDWVRLTQSQFAPVAITPDFWVVPSWHAPPPAARLVIRLDPGLAFGTGTHPTTQMCLRWLARHAGRDAGRHGQVGPLCADEMTVVNRTPPVEALTAAVAAGNADGELGRPFDRVLDRVLDYGCGSGILAIGAARVGARAIDAVDIDPAAVQATRDNAERNGVALMPGLPDLATGAYTLVLANILATPLQLLAPLLAGHVAPGGWLVMAGILERQATQLTAAYAPWLDVQVVDEQEGWVLMCARRGGSA